jgi:hypothetical protein
VVARAVAQVRVAYVRDGPNLVAVRENFGLNQTASAVWRAANGGWDRIG